ncbi:MAG TPA: phosphonate C-P lyase system protein PhnH [Paracoccus sp. (in: a-proteobacteria)]|uniref:phosphonate C-P lyase system protein PhnH n=1 Tax=Paracoccus sp. TaxID=267 RepID=UPI002C0638CF|nr:phosphonate C-P lyase system protein PhnH [Paracoccus sp. (in: a-proteobacteria)]HWL55218.1 phosphonate C-P lyase system protein PhnH [Paracoccus sp. (in: a-proteobacteria)]
MLAPDLQETQDNATFEALMWALSRPGEVRTLPEPGFPGIAQALADLETPVWTDDADLIPVLERCGAKPAAIGQAELLFAGTAAGNASAAAQARTGSALYPDEGATLIAAAALAGPTRLRLTGPGIETVREVATDLPAAFWRTRNRRIAYPAGFDLFLVEGRRVLGLPRSTMIEVL